MNRRGFLGSLLALAASAIAYPPFVPEPVKKYVTGVVNRLDITTVQWYSHGGKRLNFKVMCIMVPALKSEQVSKKLKSWETLYLYPYRLET